MRWGPPVVRAQGPVWISPIVSGSPERFRLRGSVKVRSPKLGLCQRTLRVKRLTPWNPCGLQNDNACVGCLWHDESHKVLRTCTVSKGSWNDLAPGPKSKLNLGPKCGGKWNWKNDQRVRAQPCGTECDVPPRSNLWTWARMEMKVNEALLN